MLTTYDLKIIQLDSGKAGIWSQMLFFILIITQILSSGNTTIISTIFLPS